MNKTAFALTVILAISSLLIVESANAQTIPKPSVPDFTLKYVDNSYDVPPTFEIDPYTGKNVMTQAGYNVQNKSVELTIKNQPFTSYRNENGSRVWLFYYVATKGHFENWSTIDANYWLKQKLSESYPPGFIDISDSQYTVITRKLGNISDGGQVDFRVQAIIGYSTRINTTFSGPPIGLEPGESYHYHTFTGQISDWSYTQAISIPDGAISISSPNPTSPTTSTPTTTPTPTSSPIAPDTNGNSTNLITLPLGIFVIIVAVVVLLAAALSVLLYTRHRKTAK